MTQPFLPFDDAPAPDPAPDPAPEPAPAPPIYHVIKVPRDGLPWHQEFLSVQEAVDFLSHQAGDDCWCFVFEGGARLHTTHYPNPCLVLRDGSRVPILAHVETDIDPLGSMLPEAPRRRDLLPPLEPAPSEPAS